MRVLLVGDYPPPSGGISVHVQQLHGVLRRAGIDAHVLDIGKGRQRHPDVTAAHSPWAYASRLAAFAARGYLIHLHTSGNNRKAWAVAASCAWMPLRRAPRVLTIHSGLMPEALAADPRLRQLARAAARGFSAVIAVSEPVSRALVSLPLPARRIRVHPAFIASAVAPGEPPPELAAARGRRRTLITVAHHPSPVYGRALTFQALRQLAVQRPDVGLAVFGPGTRDTAFDEAAQSAGVSHLIENFGELPHGQALALLQASDAFIRPTLADGDSISVREALALGTPTVASDVATRPAGTVLFRSQDPGDLTRALLQALAAGRRAPEAAPEADSGEATLRLYQQLTRGEGTSDEIVQSSG
ncbi:MAG TPA: glycosyltransferase family 4 protein [Myxococcaceae bacterium]|nr:glycosyltransferase family 4 protein [Myxococcaceae bacterium]